MAFDFLRTLVLGAVLLYGIVLVGVWLFSDALIFPLPANPYSIPGVTEIQSRRGDRIAALHLENPQARLTLLYSHGNGEDLESIRPLLEEFRRRGVSVLGYDYPGYGRSTGRATEASVYGAIDACYRYLTEGKGVGSKRIVLYGRSVGSGPSVDLAARERVGGLILEGGFVSAFRVVTRIPLFPFDKFKNLSKLRRVDCPVFVIQGERDEVVGYWHGPKLFAVAGEPKSFWKADGAGHNNLIAVAGERYWQKVFRFLEDVEEPLALEENRQ